MAYLQASWNEKSHHIFSGPFERLLKNRMVFTYFTVKGPETRLYPEKKKRAPLMFDVLKGQTTPKVMDFFKEKRLSLFLNPTTIITGAKRFLVEKYQDWYACYVSVWNVSV